MRRGPRPSWRLTGRLIRPADPVARAGRQIRRRDPADRAGGLRPIATPGKTGPEAPVVSLAFSFAALLFWGFGAAALLRIVSAALVGGVQRKAPHRIAFNAAQFTLSLAAAALALAAAGLHPSPGHPWLPSGAGLPGVALAAIAFFIVNFLLVGRAIALHARAPYGRTFRARLPYQASCCCPPRRWWWW